MTSNFLLSKFGSRCHKSPGHPWKYLPSYCSILQLTSSIVLQPVPPFCNGNVMIWWHHNHYHLPSLLGSAEYSYPVHNTSRVLYMLSAIRRRIRGQNTALYSVLYCTYIYMYVCTVTTVSVQGQSKLGMGGGGPGGLDSATNIFKIWKAFWPWNKPLFDHFYFSENLKLSPYVRVQTSVSPSRINKASHQYHTHLVGMVTAWIFLDLG